MRLDDREQLDARLIQPSTSPWSSPILLVVKPDGSLRVTVDYRWLNAITIKDAQPLPNMEALFDKLAEYRVMPMGLSNSPATFQRLMNKILEEEIAAGFVSVYLDDILIFSESIAEHFEHVLAVIKKIERYILKIKLTKCDVAKPLIVFLGQIISRGTIRPSTERIDTLFKYSRPTTLKQLQSFLGLAGALRKFIPDFAKRATPLTDSNIANFVEPRSCHVKSAASIKRCSHSRCS